MEKIVFVGPPGVGKSTFRKVFFEGVSIVKLLEHPLEPTYGVETFTYDFIQKIGMFDLAGQELDRWFHEETEIFQEADLIINMLDASMSIDKMIEFLDEGLPVEKGEAPDANIAIIVHKRDLIDDEKYKKLFQELKQYIMGWQYEPKIKLFFTSIQIDFLADTIETIQRLFEGTGLSEKSAKNLFYIRISSEIFRLLLMKNTIPRAKLMNELPFPKFQINAIISSLLKAKIIKMHVIHGEEIIAFTKKGIQYYSSIKNLLMNAAGVNPFNKKNEMKLSEHFEIEKDLEFQEQILGVLISDEFGKTILFIELENELLKKHLMNDNPGFDIELVSMFINALQKFSEELNILDLSQLNLQGGNIRIASITIQNITFTFFIGPMMDIKLIYNELTEFINHFMKENKNGLEIYSQFGEVTPILQNKGKAMENLKKLNKIYKEAIKIKEPVTELKLQRLYQDLCTIPEEELDIEKKLQLKDLKIEVLEALLSRNNLIYRDLWKKVKHFLKTGEVIDPLDNKI